MSTLSVDDVVVVPPGTSCKEVPATGTVVTDAVVVGKSVDSDEDKEKRKKKKKKSHRSEDGGGDEVRLSKRSRRDKGEEISGLMAATDDPLGGFLNDEEVKEELAVGVGEKSPLLVGMVIGCHKTEPANF